jgi:ParB family chromosome partitioning protein
MDWGNQNQNSRQSHNQNSPRRESQGGEKPRFAEPTKYDSIFWVEVDRIQPNPYQPRREFDEARLKSLAESIRQYGVLQPLVVTRTDVEREDGGLQSVYELIAGERRLRASKLIGLREVPVVIRVGEQTDHMKLELALIENLQREDLNAIDRAKSLAQLAQEFGLSHVEIAAKIGRSREFVSNSIRLLSLPDDVQQAVVNKELSEGHARALLMLAHKPEELNTVFKEIVLKKTSVRMVEQLVRRFAQDKIRKHDKTPEMMELEKSLTETLGTRVIIENRPNGGRLLIEFFSPEDLSNIAALFAAQQAIRGEEILQAAQGQKILQNAAEVVEAAEAVETIPEIKTSEIEAPEVSAPQEEDLYSIRNFSI